MALKSPAAPGLDGLLTGVLLTIACGCWAYWTALPFHPEPTCAAESFWNANWRGPATLNEYETKAETRLADCLSISRAPRCPTGIVHSRHPQSYRIAPAPRGASCSLRCMNPQVAHKGGLYRPSFSLHPLSEVLRTCRVSIGSRLIRAFDPQETWAA